MAIPDVFLVVFLLGAAAGFAGSRLAERPVTPTDRGPGFVLSAWRRRPAQPRSCQFQPAGRATSITLRPTPFDWQRQAPELAR